MIHLEAHGVFNDSSQVIRVLHVVLASTVVIAYVSDLFILICLEILLSLQEVIHVLVIIIVHQ